jgi:hypothetical protein
VQESHSFTLKSREAIDIRQPRAERHLDGAAECGANLATIQGFFSLSHSCILEIVGHRQNAIRRIFLPHRQL